MLTSAGFVNAEIVNVERFYIGQNIIAFVLNKNAKSIPDNGVSFIAGNEYGASIVPDHFGKLVIFIFLCAGAKYIGAPGLMNIENLAKKVVYFIYVRKFGTSYGHNFPSITDGIF